MFPRKPLQVHDRWMRQRWIRLGRQFEADEVPVGAVIVLGESIVGTGFNQRRRCRT